MAEFLIYYSKLFRGEMGEDVILDAQLRALAHLTPANKAAPARRSKRLATPLWPPQPPRAPNLDPPGFHRQAAADGDYPLTWDAASVHRPTARPAPS